MEPQRTLILASGSPRRRDLLAGLGFGFAVRPADVEEVWPPDLPPREAARYLARLKAAACRRWVDERTVVLTADTTVLLDGEVINKPIDGRDAVRMLTRLCGRTQTVVTGVALLYAVGGELREESFDEEASVTLEAATAEELEAYVAAWRPLDKAGAYGIQDWIGWAKVSRIEGAYGTVMGLPTVEVYRRLRSLGLATTPAAARGAGGGE